MNDPKDSIEPIYRRANELSGGTAGLVRQAFRSFSEARAPEAAAALAYYSMFSLFPLALALIGLGGFFVRGEQMFQRVVTLLTGATPVSRELIEASLRQILERRGTVGFVGLIGLVWSGSALFSALLHHINRAWAGAARRSFLKRRLLALAMVGGLALLLLVSMLSTPALELLARLKVPLCGGQSIYDTVLWPFLSQLVPWLTTFLMFLALYGWVPNTSVSRRGSVGGALLVAIAWELAKRGFAWYVRSGLVQYRLVYGSLGAVVALMLWIYVSSWLLLFGAHFSAALGRDRDSSD